MIEPVKVMAPMAVPSPISIRLSAWIAPRLADAVGGGRVEGRRGDADRGQADQAVEGRHQLRQRRHLDAQRDEGADGAADDDAAR